MTTTIQTARKASIATLLAATAGIANAGTDCIMYTGLEFTTVGAATASAGGDHLTISNIGSSGLDGVSIDLGESEGLSVDYFDPQPSVQLEYLLLNPIPGAADAESVRLRLEPSALGGLGQDILIGGAGASTGGGGGPHVKVFDGAALMGDAEITLKAFEEGPSQAATFPNAALPVAIDTIEFMLIDAPGAPEFQVVATFVAPSEVLLPGAAIPVVGDRVVIELPSLDADAFSQAIITASDTPQLMFENVGVGIFGATAFARGKATIEPESLGGPRLTVSNIGSSGEDGVSLIVDSFFDINNGPMSSVNREFNIGMPPSLNQTSSADAIDFTVWRDNLGVAEPAATAHVEHDEAGEFWFTHAAIGDPNQTVMFFDGFNLVHEMQIQNANDPLNPVLVATSTDPALNNLIENITWNWDAEFGTSLRTEVDIPFPIQWGGTGSASPVMADKIVIVTPQAGTTDGHKKWIDLDAVQNTGAPGQLVITSNGLTVPCPADFDGNGSVDGGDLAILLANWGGGASPLLDLNADGVIDGADLAGLLAAWGACP